MNIQDFDFSVDVLQALLWQDNAAFPVQSLLESKQAWYAAQHEAFWQDWYTNVFDLRTANAFGLAVWSAIIDQPLTVSIPVDSGALFGFGSSRQNYGHGNFAVPARNTLALSLEESRTVLQLRWAYLTSRGTVPEINATLAKYLPGGYVQDGLNMTMTYVLPFFSTALNYALTAYNVLPRPQGVSLAIILATRLHSFGFGAYNQNYSHGTFGA